MPIILLASFSNSFYATRISLYAKEFVFADDYKSEIDDFLIDVL